MHVRSRRLAVAALCAGVTSALASPAAAQIREYPLDPSATPVAEAMARSSSLVRRGVFSALPPSSKPAAVSRTRLAGFPTHGKSFAILTTGNARRADDANDAPNTGSESRGPSIRGARDVVILRVDLRVPNGHNCLSFDFRFLTEEFPEFVEDIFNDAFIAELGISNWDASSKQDPTITAPRNFALDTAGNPIRVNAVGDTTVRAEYAKGTTYDGATRKLRASTRVQPGNRRLYLSVFDQGDRIYDSAVFLDNLRTSRASSCATGVRAAS
jgi:hypothetical protein